MKDSLGAVVVNWNGLQDTRHCLQSLLAASPGAKVCVVDNGSDGDEARAIEREFGDVAVVRLGANLGYGAAWNAGIEWARAAGLSHILLLNNDTTVAPNIFERLIAAAGTLGDRAILAPLILRPDGTVWSAGSRLKWPWVAGEHIGLGDDPAAHKELGVVDWASGCALFFPVTVLSDVGPVDEEFFLYLEDIEWCLRARRRGYKIWFVPEALVRHEVTRTIRRFDPRISRYYAYRNFYLVGFRHAAPHWRLWLSGHLVLTLAKIGLRCLTSPRLRNDSLYHARTRAVLDYLRRRLGPAPYEHRLLDLEDTVAVAG